MVLCPPWAPRGRALSTPTAVGTLREQRARGGSALKYTPPIYIFMLYYCGMSLGDTRRVMGQSNNGHVIAKSAKLRDVLYEIRGPVAVAAAKLMEQGEDVLRLNIGNPALFDFQVPEEISRALADNLHRSEAYVESRGVQSVREEILEHYRWQGVGVRSIDDIYVGNGVSELITMTLQGLVDTGDEVLLPAPDYPLWTAATCLSGGVPCHYQCDEDSGWLPNVDDIKAKITERTRVLVIINPNNPTGAVYPRELLEKLADIAARHRLIICADEIYGHMTYDGARHYPMGAIAHDTLCISYSGLSKNHLACGFRAGWMVLTGTEHCSGDYQDGLNMLSNMRLCSNVPAQYGIPPALNLEREGRASAAANKKLAEQRDAALQCIDGIPGFSCVKPKAACYLFPKLDGDMYDLKDDMQLVLDMLHATKVLVIQGSGFNLHDNCHFRMTFLPDKQTLISACNKIGEFLASYPRR